MKKLTEKQIRDIVVGSLIPPELSKLLKETIPYDAEHYPNYYTTQKLIRDFCDTHIAINPIISKNKIIWDYDIYRISTATHLPDISSKDSFSSWESAFDKAATKVLTKFKKQLNDRDQKPKGGGQGKGSEV